MGGVKAVKVLHYYYNCLFFLFLTTLFWFPGVQLSLGLQVNFYSQNAVLAATAIAELQRPEASEFQAFARFLLI